MANPVESRADPISATVRGADARMMSAAFFELGPEPCHPSRFVLEAPRARFVEADPVELDGRGRRGRVRSDGLHDERGGGLSGCEAEPADDLLPLLFVDVRVSALAGDDELADRPDAGQHRFGGAAVPAGLKRQAAHLLQRRERPHVGPDAQVAEHLVEVLARDAEVLGPLCQCLARVGLRAGGRQARHELVVAAIGVAKQRVVAVPATVGDQLHLGPDAVLGQDDEALVEALEDALAAGWLLHEPRVGQKLALGHDELHLVVARGASGASDDEIVDVAGGADLDADADDASVLLEELHGVRECVRVLELVSSDSGSVGAGDVHHVRPYPCCCDSQLPSTQVSSRAVSQSGSGTTMIETNVAKDRSASASRPA